MLIEWARSLLSKPDNILGLAVILILVAILVVAISQPDSRQGRIRNELARQGYTVEHVEFEFVKDVVRSAQWVFKSSESISFNGNNVEYWLLTRRPRGSMWPSIMIYSVEPYTS